MLQCERNLKYFGKKEISFPQKSIIGAILCLRFLVKPSVFNGIDTFPLSFWRRYAGEWETDKANFI